MGQLGRARTFENRTEEEHQWRLAGAKALENAGLFEVAWDFEKCGDPDYIFSVLVCPEDPHHHCKHIPHTCKNRFCPECAWRETARLLKRYMPVLKVVFNKSGAYRLRHIVLTTDLRLTDEDAPAKYRQALNAVGKLFDELLSKNWRQGQGYILGSEFGEQGRKLHFHVLFYGQFLKKRQLSDTWEKLTGYKVTYIKLVDNVEKAAGEVLKYCTKLTEVPPEELPDLYRVLKGTRRIRSRGIFYNIPVVEEEHAATCPVCGQALVMWGEPYYRHWLEMEDLANLTEPLDLKHGNKSPPLEQLELAGLDGKAQGYFQVGL